MAYIVLTRAVILFAIVLLAACRSTASSADTYGTTSDSICNPLEAQQLTAQAAVAMDSQPAEAEALLRRVVIADPFHGPAHNNLGVLMLNSKPPRLYEAAHEFEWAGKLMPGHPDPRHNLAMTLEAAARYDEAISAYRVALETVRETEAEAVAFVVCEAAGLETGTASSDYIQLYQGDTDTLAASLERIQHAAAAIMAALHAATEQAQAA